MRTAGACVKSHGELLFSLIFTILHSQKKIFRVYNTLIFFAPTRPLFFLVISIAKRALSSLDNTDSRARETTIRG
jgi:hypothetical protein